MRLCDSPDIFQEKIKELFNGLEYVRAYIDDLLIISNGTFEDHLNRGIKDISILNNKKQLRSFIGVIDYNRDIQKHRLDILTPLTKKTSKQATWNWTEVIRKPLSI